MGRDKDKDRKMFWVLLLGSAVITILSFMVVTYYREMDYQEMTALTMAAFGLIMIAIWRKA